MDGYRFRLPIDRQPRISRSCREQLPAKWRYETRNPADNWYSAATRGTATHQRHLPDFKAWPRHFLSVNCLCSVLASHHGVLCEVLGQASRGGREPLLPRALELAGRQEPPASAKEHDSREMTLHTEPSASIQKSEGKQPNQEEQQPNRI